LDQPALNISPVIADVAAAGLTYLETAALLDLYQAVRSLEKAGTPGAIIECGCALGGSAIVLASGKSPLRPMLVYDVFGMIPPPSEKDDADVQQRYETIRSGQSSGIGGAKYYGYEDDLYGKVAAAFERFFVPLEANNVQLVRGLFQDTLHVDQPVALAHLDGDWYESTMTCLSRIAPRIVPGGRLVIDDYDAWSGCRKAVDEYFASRGEEFKFERQARMHVVKQ
jgi:asparagine synthase (glutamine-hydrolysing)